MRLNPSSSSKQILQGDAGIAGIPPLTEKAFPAALQMSRVRMWLWWSGEESVRTDKGDVIDTTRIARISSAPFFILGYCRLCPSECQYEFITLDLLSSGENMRRFVLACFAP
jgi:hypothetical protein